MKIHFPFHHHHHSHTQTRFITLDTHLCSACWECIEVCPQGVLGRVRILSHKHARVDHPEACKGCKKCVRQCPEHAIQWRLAKPSHQPVQEVQI